MSHRALGIAGAVTALALALGLLTYSVRNDQDSDLRSSGRHDLGAGPSATPTTDQPVPRKRKHEAAPSRRKAADRPSRSATHATPTRDHGATKPAKRPSHPGTTAARGCFDRRGVSRCGPLVGSAYGSNSDPAPFESSIGHTLGLRRTYWTASQVDSAVKTARSDLAHGRLPWMSFKLPASWEAMAAGDGDAWARGLASRLAALPGPVWVAFHHEPEGDGDIAAWTRMQEHLAPLVRSTAPNVGYTVVLTGWHELYGDAQYRLDAIWPDVKVDVAGFDVYNSLGVVKDGKTNTKGTDLPSAYFKPLSAWARSRGVAWGLAETGYTDYASEIRPHWIAQTTAAMKAYGGVAFAYFNTTLNSIAPWHLGTTTKMADFRAAQAQSLMLKR